MRDIYHRETKLRYWTNKVRESKEFTDMDDILRFVEYLQENERSALSIARTIQVLIVMRRMLGKPFREAKKDDIKRLLDAMENRGYKPATHEKFRSVLKFFYKVMFGDKEYYPEQVRWVKRKVSKDHYRYDEDLSHEEYLTEEEIGKAIEAAPTIQKKAFIGAGYESGGRPEELMNLRFKDVHFDERGAALILRGKTGERRVRIVAYAPLLRQWTGEHPFKDDPVSYLWLTESTNCKFKPLGLWGAEKIIREAMNRSGIKKRSRIYLLRHSRATHLASHLTEAQMWAYFGWVPGTKVVRRYVHLSGRDVDGAILASYGLSDERKEKSLLTPKRCLRCKELMSPNMEFCPRCSLPNDVKAVYEGNDERYKKLEEKMINLERIFATLLSRIDPDSAKMFQSTPSSEIP